MVKNFSINFGIGQGLLVSILVGIGDIGQYWQML